MVGKVLYIQISLCIDITVYKVSSYFWSFFWSVFSAFGLNTEGYSLSLCISPNAGKYGPENFRIRTLFTQCVKLDINCIEELHFLCMEETKLCDSFSVSQFKISGNQFPALKAASHPLNESFPLTRTEPLKYYLVWLEKVLVSPIRTEDETFSTFSILSLEKTLKKL